MFYLKTEVDGKKREVEIYDDEIYTKCFNCGKEMQVDTDTLIAVLEDGDFSSTSIACCNNKKPTIARIK